MKKNLLKGFIIPALFCFLTGAVLSQGQNNIRVLSYYAGPSDSLDNYNVNQMTHIIFCFGRLNGNRFGTFYRNNIDTGFQSLNGNRKRSSG